MLRACVAAYGYDNLALVRTQRGDTVDIPWNWVPTDFAEAYVTQGWESCDPELAMARRTQFPFSWDSVPQRMQLTSKHLKMIGAAGDFGMQNGLCVPLRGTDGRVDMISLSCRTKRQHTDTAYRNAAALLALRALALYLELNDTDAAARRPPRRAQPIVLLDDLASDRFTVPFTLPAEHLRALALIDVGARRWQRGLTRLASRLYLLRTLRPFHDLQRWGFIVDEADDLRWRYYLAPSVLGMSYLRRTPGSAALRRDIWERERGRREISDGLEAE